MATTLSFARAFSTRREKPEIEPIWVGRAATQRCGRPVYRAQISSPMALVSTSNVNVYNAQLIAGTRPIEIRSVSGSSSDSNSSDESDATYSSSLHSSGMITDASSIDESPIEMSTSSDGWTSFYKPAFSTVMRARSGTDSSADSIDYDRTPRIPQRAPSHSKAAHEAVHRKKSLQRVRSPPPATTSESRSSFDIIGGTSAIKQSTVKRLLPPLSFETSSEPTRSYFDIIGNTQPGPAPMLSPQERPSPVSSIDSSLDSPFEQEIAQLQEVASGFGNAVRSEEEDEDVMYLEKRGFAVFSATDYMFEIQSLIHTMFADEQPFFKHLGGFF